MKKPSSKIREEIARLQDQLKHAETREAERIGRIALKAGFGEFEVDETELQEAFEILARRFRDGQQGQPPSAIGGRAKSAQQTAGPDEATGQSDEA